ncbi:MAG: tRNA glutamyl-Q(34) synthetase GluQRS [Sphingomonadales bacterium]|nr:tRNA glutamyl-Q(34) synthetase GluQRS [Sphingomonadales bacterium]
MIRTRFAPSPNGSLHLGHAYSALVAHDLARARGGEFLLRIEDIDAGRSRPELVGEFLADLAWLGLAWDAELVFQSARTCRGREIDPEGAAWRLDTAKAAALASERNGGPLEWLDELAGPQRAAPEIFGDVVLLRKEAPASYHLAATLDDAADGVTLVTRGADLFAASHVHRLLQALLVLPVPTWHHHALLVEADGTKLAKRRGSPSLADRRRAGEDGRALAAMLRAHRFPAGISLGEGLHPLS